MNRREEREAERRREAEAALRRAESEGEVVGSSALGSTGRRLADHFGAGDAPADDAVEIWGRRIGRVLALLAALALIAHLVRSCAVG